MNSLKKLLPGIAVFIFTGIFLLLQVVPAYRGITVPFLQETEPTTSLSINTLSVLDYGCSDVAISYTGFPFRMNGYDYCGEGGIMVIPIIINTILYLVISYFIYRLAKRLAKM